MKHAWVMNRIKFRRNSRSLLLLWVVLHFNIINDRKKKMIILHTAYETNFLSSHGNRFYRISTFVMSVNAIRMQKELSDTHQWFHFRRKYFVHILQNVSCITHFACWQWVINVFKAGRNKKFYFLWYCPSQPCLKSQTKHRMR